MRGFKGSITFGWVAKLREKVQQSNRFVWVALIGLTVVTFAIGTFWGAERASSFAFIVEGSPIEDSTYDATGKAPVLVPLEMNKDEFLELSPEGREALRDFWQNYILELTSKLAGAIIAGVGDVYSEDPAASITMIVVSWAYPDDYRMIVETDRKTFQLPPSKVELPQPRTGSRRFLAQRVSFVMTFQGEKILSAFEHSLASPAWHEKPELPKAIYVDTKVEKRVPDGSVILTFTDRDGGTTTIQAKLPLPLSRSGAEPTRVRTLTTWYSYALSEYIKSLFKSGGFDKALAGHDRVTRMTLKIKKRSDDWKGELTINLAETGIIIPPPPILQIYFFGF